MRQFTIKGTVRITYEWHVNETVEVEDDEDGNDAIEAILDDLDPYEDIDIDTDTFGLGVEELDGSGEDLAARRQRDLALLEAWNSGRPIAA